MNCWKDFSSIIAAQTVSKLQYEILWGAYPIEIWDTQESVLLRLARFVIFWIDKYFFVPLLPGNNS